MKKSIEKITAFSFGVIFIVTILVVAIFISEPTDFQYIVFRIILALASAGVAAMIPGFLSVEVSTSVRAGGAIAVFVIVYFFSPASLVSNTSNLCHVPPQLEPIVSGKPTGNCKAEYKGSTFQLFSKGWLISHFETSTFIAIGRKENGSIEWTKIRSNFVKGVETENLGIQNEEFLRLGFRWYFLKPDNQRVRELLGYPLTIESRAWIQFQEWSEGWLIYGLPGTKPGIEQGQFQVLAGFFLENFSNKKKGEGLFTEVDEGDVEGEVYLSALWYPATKGRKLSQHIINFIASGLHNEARGPDLFTKEHAVCLVY